LKPEEVKRAAAGRRKNVTPDCPEAAQLIDQVDV